MEPANRRLTRNGSYALLVLPLLIIGRCSSPAVPKSIRYPSTNETLDIKDHQIVFQLAAKLNQLNGGDPKLFVDFIPWIQTSDNAPYYYNGVRNADGTVPTVRITDHSLARSGWLTAQQVAEAASASSAPLPPGVQQVQGEIADLFYSPDRLGAIANNMYRAHKQFIGKQNAGESVRGE